MCYRLKRTYESLPTACGLIFSKIEAQKEGKFQNDRGLENEALAHLVDLGAYSTRPHGVALFRLDREKHEFIKILDLPGCGDTAFPVR